MSAAVKSDRKKEYAFYDELRTNSKSFMLKSASILLIFTCILVCIAVTNKLDPLFYQISYPMWLGVPGALLIGSLIAFAIAKCKLGSFSDLPENQVNYDTL